MTGWLNEDKLYQKFGREQGVAGIAGAFASPADGSQTVVEFDLDLTTLGSSPAIISDVVWLPKNSRIERVEIRTLVAATSNSPGSGTLNVGLVKTADRTTAVEADGILKVVPLTTMDAAGETTSFTVAASGAGGDLVGVAAGIGAYPAYITADYDTASYATGSIHVKVFIVQVS